MSLSKNIRTIRKKWELNQKDFGALLGMGKTAVSKWELGENEPSLKTMLWLSDNTGISIRRLVLEELERSDIVDSPGGSLAAVKEKEESRLKSKIAELVMDLDDAEKEKKTLLNGLVNVISYLEGTMDESVYRAKKTELMARLRALLGADVGKGK